MPTKFELTRQTKARISDTMDFIINDYPELMTQLSPDVFKQVTIKSRDADNVTYEWRGEFMRRKMVGVNRITLNRGARTAVEETIEGTGKGSKMTHSLRELPNGTELHYTSAMEFGALGFLAKGAWKSVIEKALDEIVKMLDARGKSMKSDS
jgi:hypothetical protein